MTKDRQIAIQIVVLLLLWLGGPFATAVENKLRFNPELSIADLLEEDGTLYLFRYISQEYIPGHQGIVSRHTGLVSYTINPLIFVNGQSFGYELKAPHILIAKHNIKDKLTFVDENSIGLGENPLLPSAKISDFNKLTYEVEVPVEKENVVRILTLKEFMAMTKFTSDIETGQDFQQIVRKLMQDTSCLQSVMR